MTTVSPSQDVKGKGRATETTPLLSEATSSTHGHRLSADPEQQVASTQEQRHRRLRTTLINVFVGTLATVVVFFVIGVLLVYSYAQRARRLSPDQLAEAIIWRGPSSVDVLGIKEGGEINVNVKGLLGVDTDFILGFRSEDDDNDSALTMIWKDVGRWGVGILGRVTVQLGQMMAYEANGSVPIAWATTNTFEIHLSSHPGSPQDPSWLRPVEFNITAQPSQDSSLLKRFMEDAWTRGMIDLDFNLNKLSVHGGSETDDGWRSLVQSKQQNLTVPFQYRIPISPGLPDERPPLMEMLELVSYSLVQDKSRLSIYALATIPNPLNPMHLSIPQIPYEVSLLAPPLQPLPISAGTVAPQLTFPNVSLPITGKVLPLSSPESSSILSSFLSQFLGGIAPPISIRSPLLPNLTIETTFPPPIPPPRILQDVTMKHMSLAVAPGGGMLASGLVWATIALPPGFHMTVNVTHVWPDVLVYDGPIELDPPEDEEDEMTKPRPKLPPVHPPKPKKPKLPDIEIPRLPINLPWHDGPPTPTPHTPTVPHWPSKDDPPPLPDPLPDRAFARIRPTDWLVAHTEEVCQDDIDDSNDSDNSLDDDWVLVKGSENQKCNDLTEGGGWKAIITANVEKVPLQVLPGRDKEFRSFIQRAILSGKGATAGLRGVAGVRSDVVGLIVPGDGAPRDVELHGLPFEGNVLVGKRSAL